MNKQKSGRISPGILIIVWTAIIAVALGVAIFWPRPEIPENLENAPALSAPAAVSVKVYFNNGLLNPNLKDCALVYPRERLVPVPGGGLTAADKLAAALNELFRGPTDAEKDAGYVSWFSSATASILKSVRLDGDTAHVDLIDIRGLIPNASSSCGSAELLAEMETTLKQFPEVSRVVFSINGDPRTFYEWLQLSYEPENENK